MEKLNYMVVINVYDGPNILSSYNRGMESPPSAETLDNLCRELLRKTKTGMQFTGPRTGAEAVAVVHGVFAF